MLYFQLMSQMTPGPSVGTSGTQYETLRASSYDTLASPAECSRRKHLPTQGTSVLAVKSDQETHTSRLSLGKYFIGIDVFFLISGTLVCILFYSRNCTLFSLFMV
jgi:hypothetical protein